MKSLGILITPSMYLLTTDGKEITLLQTSEESVVADYASLAAPNYVLEEEGGGNGLEGKEELVLERGHIIMTCCCVEPEKCKVAIENVIVSVNLRNGCEAYPVNPRFFHNGARIEGRALGEYAFLLNRGYLIGEGELGVEEYFECESEVRRGESKNMELLDSNNFVMPSRKSL